MPDVLEPRRYDSHIGDAAPSCITDIPAFNAWLIGPQGVAYGAAMDALKTFDAAHGGAPIL